MKKQKMASQESSFLLYTTSDGKEKIEVRLEKETVWLTQAAMAELFQTTPQNTIHRASGKSIYCGSTSSPRTKKVNDFNKSPFALSRSKGKIIDFCNRLHFKEIFAEGELSESATCKENLQVQKEGVREVNRVRKFYNLEAILAVGYRVRSHRGTQFRKWATNVLRKHLVDGDTINEKRLKVAEHSRQASGKRYDDKSCIESVEIGRHVSDLYPSWHKPLTQGEEVSYSPS